MNQNLPKKDRDAAQKVAKQFARYRIAIERGGRPIHDTFAINLAQDGTKGTITFKGTAVYIDGVNRRPNGFLRGGGQQFPTHSGSLLSISKKNPNYKNAIAQLLDLGDVSKKIKHSITVKWDATQKGIANQVTKIVKYTPKK